MSGQVLRVFVSSPGDVMDERRRVEAIAERLNGEFGRRVTIEVVRWETSYYSAHETFQKQIPESADCDVVVAVFRARLGTALPADFRTMPGGGPYPSGTAYEVLTAIEARKLQNQRPDVYVFRYANPPSVELDDPNGPAVKAEWERLKGFFDTWFRTPDGRFLAAFQSFDSTDDFAAKIEDCLRQWLARHGMIDEGPVWDRTLKGPPFPGLMPYDPEHRGVFFGRDLDVAHAIQRLRDVGANGLPFLLLIGASDAGKSSLMCAGILPRLTSSGTIPEVDLWRHAYVIPGPEPLSSLARALFEGNALGDELRQGDFSTPDVLAKLFAADSADASVAPIRTALGRAAEARAQKLNYTGTRPARLALAIDQVERLLFEVDSATVNVFARLVAALVEGGLAYVIMTLRSDGYPRFQLIDALRDLRSRGTSFDLVPPGTAEIEEIITKPVSACRPPLAFETKDGRSLAQVLVADATSGDALPLLQMALARLFKAEAARGDGMLRFADYSGLGPAVSQTAQDVLATLDQEAQTQVPALILALVRDVVADSSTDELRPVVSALDRHDFEKGKPSRKKLVDAFITHRLLVVESVGNIASLRPAHEALLRIWPEAVTIIRDNMANIRVRHLLRPIVREWAAAREDAKCNYLDLPAALVAGARQLMDTCRDDLTPEMQDFVTRALKAADDRQQQEMDERTANERMRTAVALASAERRLVRRTAAGMLLTITMSVTAGIGWYQAHRQGELAENRLNLASEYSNALVTDFAHKFRDIAGVPISQIKDILDQLSRFQTQIQGDGSVTPELLQSRAAALDEMANTLVKLGDTEGAFKAAGESHDKFTALLKIKPNNSAVQLALSKSAKTLASILRSRGNLKDAYADYAESLDIGRKLFAQNKGNADWQHDLTETENMFGDLLMSQGDLIHAREAYQRGLDVVEKVPVEADQLKDRWNSDLAWSYSKIGDLDIRQNDVEDALAHYERSLKIRQSLATKDASNTEWQHDVWISDNKSGDAFQALGALPKAYGRYGDGLAIIKALADRDDANKQWKGDLSESRRKMGDILLAQGKPTEARAAFVESLDIIEPLSDQDTANTDWSWDLILVNWKLAQLGDKPGQRVAFVVEQLHRLGAESPLTEDQAQVLRSAETEQPTLSSE